MSWSATPPFAEIIHAREAKLGRLSTPQAEAPSNAARGIVIGLCLSVPCWAAVIAMIVRL